jgi:hypothetical protein
VSAYHWKLKEGTEEYAYNIKQSLKVKPKYSEAFPPTIPLQNSTGQKLKYDLPRPNGDHNIRAADIILQASVYSTLNPFLIVTTRETTMFFFNRLECSDCYTCICS